MMQYKQYEMHFMQYNAKDNTYNTLHRTHYILTIPYNTTQYIKWNAYRTIQYQRQYTTIQCIQYNKYHTMSYNTYNAQYNTHCRIPTIQYKTQHMQCNICSIHYRTQYKTINTIPHNAIENTIQCIQYSTRITVIP